MKIDLSTEFGILFLIELNKLGIIPFCENKSDFRKAMNSLTQNERRIAKRKFRKIWRKLENKWKPRTNNVKNKETIHPDKLRKKIRQFDVFQHVANTVKEKM